MIKPKGCTFEPTFLIREVPYDLETQLEYTDEKLSKFNKRINEKLEVFRRIPVSTMKDRSIKKKMKELQQKHFIDPEFPPNNSSL